VTRDEQVIKLMDGN